MENDVHDDDDSRLRILFVVLVCVDTSCGCANGELS